MKYIPTSAQETFECRGYSTDEARRVRGFMPRRFGDIAPALPLTNIEFWIAYECVKHYNENSRDRGRFFALDTVDFRFNGKIEYRSKSLNETFHMREFLRHFADILYTNYDPEKDMKVPALNADGSLVIKNRISATRLVEIKKQAEETGDYMEFTINHSEYPVGKLTLPPKGSITPSVILNACFHGQLAREVIWGNGNRQLPTALKFEQLATYLYLKRLYAKQDRQFGSDYESERSTALLNLTHRTPVGYHNPSTLPEVFAAHIGGNKVIDRDGEHATSVSAENDFPYFTRLYRYQGMYGTNAVVDLPAELYAEFTQPVWIAALA